MKQFFSIIFFLLITYSNFAQDNTVISLNSNKKSFKTDNCSLTGFTLNLSVSEIQFKHLKYNGEHHILPEIQGFVKSFNEGKPNLPSLIKLIEIPFNSSVRFKIIEYDEQIINLSDYKIDFPVMPAKRSQSKSEDDLPFIKDDNIYNKNEFWSEEIISFKNSGIMRAASLGEIKISPILYNPVRHVIKVINNLKVEVIFEDADVSKTTELKKKYASPYFSDFLKRKVINDLNLTQNKELITQSSVHYVIVSDRMFEEQLEPFIDWKVKKGFNVTVGYTDEIGNSTTSIKTWLQSIYEGSNPMSFVLFVGDIQQIPAYSSNGHYTDLYYCEYSGDKIPDVYYGRFSAQNTDQLQPQLDKTLLYEKYQMSDPSYLEDNVLIAGVDGTYAPTYGNGAINYGAAYYFNEEHDINPLTYLYADSENSTVMASNTTGASGSVFNNINSGVGFANYTAHCSSSGWANPSFGLSNVSSLTNNQKYGLWIGNCCQSSMFGNTECFAEAVLRKENGGAIGYIGASDYTYWDEDYWWGIGLKSGSATANPTYEETGLGAFDAIFHDKENEVEDLSSWYPAQGQINMAGNLAVQASSSGLKTYYWEIYHLMGDPSLMPFIGTPKTISVSSSPESLIMGMSSLSVNSAPYTYVALSQNGVLIDAKISDAGGFVLLNFNSDALSVGEADLVVTGQNKIPYIEKIIVSPADEPYVVLKSYTTDISPDCGETVALNVTMENLAESDSGNDAYEVESVMYEDDEYVSIIDNNETYGTLLSGNNLEINDAFQISIADNVTDQYKMQFNIINQGTDVNSNSFKWYSKLNLTINAPKFTINDLIIDDAAGNNDGILDVGETADIIVNVTNSGHADANDAVGYLSTADYNLIINNSSTSPQTINFSQSQNFIFNVTVSSTAERGTGIGIEFVVREGQSTVYFAESDFELAISGNSQYCSSYAVYTADSRIDSVRFGNSIFNGTTSEGCSKYSDFTDMVADVFQGGSDSLVFVLGTCGGNYSKGAKVFIDWNRDKDFDDGGELVYTTSITSVSQTDTVEIFIPEDAEPGFARMRIVCKETSDASYIYSCGSYSWGETEDYTLNILKPISVAGSLISDTARICSGGNTGVMRLINYTGTIDDWQRRLDNGSWVGLGNNADEFNEELNTPGLYEYRVSVNSGTAFSDTILLQVDDITNGGSLSSVSAICEHENTGEIILTGNNGYVQKWIKKLNDGDWEDINSSSSIMYDVLDVSGNWYYRTVVKNGTCESDSSETSNIIVNDAAIAGDISPAENKICIGNNVNLQLNNYDGSIQWMESVDGIIWDEIPGEVSENYISFSLDEDQYFKAVVSITGCKDDEVSKRINVKKEPFASFDYELNDKIITFINTSDFGETYFWDFGDGFGSSTVFNPEYIYESYGVYDVVLEVSNGICTNSVYEKKIEITDPTKPIIEKGFKISPNPSFGIIQINISEFEGSKYFNICNLNGKIIREMTTEKDLIEFDLSDQAPGLYFINVIYEGKSYNEKFIIR